MVEEVRTISTTEIPDWLKKYQDEILTRAQALGKDEGFVLPQYQVAGRTPLQGQASQLAASGVGSYFPMLQAGAGTVGQGVGGLQQAQQAMMQGYAPLDAATQMTGNAVMGAQPYQQVAYDAMGQAIPTTMAAAQAGQEMAALGRQDLGTAAGQVLGAGSRGELAAAGGVQGILGAAMQGDVRAAIRSEYPSSNISWSSVLGPRCDGRAASCTNRSGIWFAWSFWARGPCFSVRATRICGVGFVASIRATDGIARLAVCG
jgi:hypothetical protein